MSIAVLLIPATLIAAIIERPKKVYAYRKRTQRVIIERI